MGTADTIESLKMIYCFDIDGTICDTDGNDYENAVPRQDMISKINELYEHHQIKLFTGRGCTSGIDWEEFTEYQLRTLCGLKYHELICNIKPHFDLLIDDRAMHVDQWISQNIKKKVGFLAGCFDLIHPGYIKMLEEAKTVCDHLIVGLHSDPTIDRPNSHKEKPIQSCEERNIILSSVKWVDEIILYNTEQDLYNILATHKIDIRILGSDYIDKPYTGDDLDIEIYYHTRDHNWSTTSLKQKIRNQHENNTHS